MNRSEIREFRDSDMEEICAVFHASFGKAMTAEAFRWKYLDSPWRNRGYVALFEGKIVAFYGGLMLPFRYNGNDLRVYQFCDVMTHPDYRGRLMGRTPFIAMLGDMFYRENPMDFAYGFPSLRHARLQSLRLGGEGYRLVRVYRKENLGEAPVRGRYAVREGWEHFSIEKVQRFLDRSDIGTLQFMKNARYLAWRYRDNPTGKYRFFDFRRLFATRGYAVCSLEDDWLSIMDIFPGNSDNIKDMLISLENWVAGNRYIVRGIQGWFHPEEEVVPYIEACGYAGDDSIPVAFKSVNAESGVDAELFYGKYYYRMGDYDAS